MQMQILRLIKNLSVTLGSDFRKQIHTNFVRVEDFINKMSNDREYHRTEEENAHSSNQVSDEKFGTVENGLNTINNRYSNLVLSKGKNSLQEVKDARVDAKGKAHATLFDRLLSDGVELGLQKDEIIKELEETKNKVLSQEFMFDIPNQSWQYLTNLSPFTNSVMQSFHLDNKTGLFYQTQAYRDHYKLSKLASNGQLLSQMEIEGGGHGTHNGYRWIDDKLWIYSHIKDHEGFSKIVRFTYKPNKSISYGDYDMEEVFTGHPELPYMTPLINEHEGLMLFRIEYPKSEWTTRNARNYVEVRRLEDIDNRVDKVLYRMDIPMDLTNGDIGQPMQGVAFDDGILYWYTGDSNPDVPNFLTAFDLKTKKQLWQKSADFGKIGNEFPGNFAEAEGIQIYYDIETGKKALLAGVTVGAPNYRAHQIHGIFMRDVYDKLTAQGTPVLMTETGGRTKSYPVANFTKIADITEPGYYYMNTVDTINLTDFPVPVEMRNAGWFLEVSAPNVAGDVQQTLTRNSYTRDLMIFKRMVSIYQLNSETGNPATSWNHVKSSSVDGVAEGIPDHITNMNQLGIITNKRWYCDTERSSQIKDHPNPGVAGWTVDVESVTANVFKVVLNRVTSSASMQRYEAYFSSNKYERTSPWTLFQGTNV
jgi:hypothetical protein